MLFADIVDLCCDVVQRYGGTVDKFTGDGVMAVFGAPIALEDYAIRACLAAIDIQHRVQNLAGEVSSRDGIELALRVGLNSGEVTADEVGSRSASYTTIEFLVEAGFVLHELPLLRAQALLTRADGDDAGYVRYRDRYRARAYELDYEAHIDTAEAMD